MKNKLFASVPNILFGALITIAPQTFAHACTGHDMPGACHYSQQAATGIGVVLLWFPLPFGFVLWFFRLRFEVVLRVAFPFRFFVRFIWWHPWRQGHHAPYRTEIRFDRLCRA